ncbi:DoxX-like protein [Roseivirga pacifica]|uniref:DoxX-like family protein n=1 Tax=Roseivirga pacifica TaxID=1267423 RepID=A0A1I0PYD9_9BACT|nr:DoxX family protein [Roseivirga pacifica]RKQ43414.1 DoxX-like protein [Roseivirga pacifica]SEW19645.1 DoxX-like family protein [Roseivirga pacifica]
MKKVNIIYWVATGLISLMMAFSAFSYFTNPDVAAGFVHLGFPDYFRIELGIAKVIGVIVLLAPVWPKLKEWAYAGFTINFISAFIAHQAVGDSLSDSVGPIIALVLLAISYWAFGKKQASKAAN